MKVYIAALQENNYETEPWNIGVYTTVEKAKKALLDKLKEIDPSAPLLSIETYTAQDVPAYEIYIEDWDLDDIEED